MDCIVHGVAKTWAQLSNLIKKRKKKDHNKNSISINQNKELGEGGMF